jgi:hypothetical protein
MSAKHRRGEFAPGRFLGAALDLADELRQQLTKRQRAAAHLGLTVDQTGPEQTLHGAHQAPLVAGQIFGQRRTSEGDFLVVRIKEDDRRQGGLAVLQSQHHRLAGTHPADGGIRRAKIDAASNGHVDPSRNKGALCYQKNRLDSKNCSLATWQPIFLTRNTIFIAIE